MRPMTAQGCHRSMPGNAERCGRAVPQETAFAKSLKPDCFERTRSIVQFTARMVEPSIETATIKLSARRMPANTVTATNKRHSRRRGDPTRTAARGPGALSPQAPIFANRSCTAGARSPMPAPSPQAGAWLIAALDS